MNNKGYYFALLTAFISGWAIFLNKFGVQGINPYLYTFLRVSLVAIFLTSSFFFLKERQFFKQPLKIWLFLILIGLVGGSLPFLLFFKGLSLTSSSQASFIHKTMFLWVAFLAYLFLKEKIEKRFFLGGVFLLIANLILLRTLKISLNFGDLLIFLATFFWSIENVLSKYLLKNLPVRLVAWSRMFFGSLFIFLFLLINQQITPIFHLNFKQVFWISFTALILLSYLISWYQSLKTIPVSQATAILTLGSPITSFLNLLSTGKINNQELIGSFLIIGGVIFILGLKNSWQLIKDFKKLIYVRP